MPHARRAPDPATAGPGARGAPSVLRYNVAVPACRILLTTSRIMPDPSAPAVERPVAAIAAVPIPPGRATTETSVTGARCVVRAAAGIRVAGCECLSGPKGF